MNERVARLREQSLSAVPTLSLERAHLVTEFDRQARGLSAPLYRARLLQLICKRQMHTTGDYGCRFFFPLFKLQQQYFYVLPFFFIK